MENTINIASTFKTPLIDGDINKGILKIAGKSLPEDAKAFFQPVRLWLANFYQTTASSIEVTIQLEYYNTASSKFLVNLLLQLEKLQAQKSVVVNWIYDEDDIEMQETGEDFQNLIGDMIVLKANK